MTKRQQILQRTFTALIHASCWCVRAMYRLLYGWGKYRPFVWQCIEVEAVIRGTSRTWWSRTPESDARVREIDKAVKAGGLVLSSEEAFDRLVKKTFGKIPKD